jgi:hypothetical protein
MTLTREPAIYLRVLAAGLALLVGFGISPMLTESTTQLILAFVAAGVGAWQAFKVRPVAPSVLATVLTTGFALAAAFNLVHVTEGQTALVLAFVEGALALWLRPQSTPIAAPGDKQATVG